MKLFWCVKPTVDPLWGHQPLHFSSFCCFFGEKQVKRRRKDAKKIWSWIISLIKGWDQSNLNPLLLLRPLLLSGILSGQLLVWGLPSDPSGSFSSTQVGTMGAGCRCFELLPRWAGWRSSAVTSGSLRCSTPASSTFNLIDYEDSENVDSMWRGGA